MAALIAICRALLRTRWLPAWLDRRWGRCFGEREVHRIFGDQVKPLTAGHLLGWRALPDSWWVNPDLPTNEAADDV